MEGVAVKHSDNKVFFIAVKNIKESLSVIKNLYDVLRIVDPKGKKTLYVEGENEVSKDENCYEFWRSGKCCENCISMRAYNEEDTFFKVEYNKEKVFLITAAPVIVDSKKYVVEILKNITEKGFFSEDREKSITKFKNIIRDINELAIIDELTGIYNRRYINERMPVDVSNNILENKPISIIMADIDFFKNINDTYGHSIGDKIIKDVANILKENIRRSSDWVARYGGEEFFIVLNDTTGQGAYTVAEKIRKIIEEKEFTYNSLKIKLTLSFGVHTIDKEKSGIENFIEEADKSLYEAKNSGRNKTVVR